MRVTGWCVLAGWLAQAAPAEAVDLVRRHLHRRVSPESLLSWAPDERARLQAKWENRIAFGSPADGVAPAPILERDQRDERDDGGTLDRRREALEARQEQPTATVSASISASSARSLSTPSATGSGQVALTNYQSDLCVTHDPAVAKLSASTTPRSRSALHLSDSTSYSTRGALDKHEAHLTPQIVRPLAGKL